MNTKTCAKCSLEKDFELFGTDKTKKDKLCAICKQCAKEKFRLFSRSKSGLPACLYNSQVTRSVTKGFPRPSYSLNEFKAWISRHEDYDRLFNNWVLSGYKKELRPSVDRLDDYKYYDFSNIQLITWGDNNAKGRRDRRSGTNNKVSKRVTQLTADNKVIESYPSVRYAARMVGVNASGISKCCKKQRTQCGGFRWAFSEY